MAQQRPQRVTILGAGAIGMELLDDCITHKIADEVHIWNRPEEKKIFDGNMADFDEKHAQLLVRDAETPRFYGHCTANEEKDLEVALKDAEIVVIAGGAPRQPGQKRKDLIPPNAPGIEKMAIAVAKYAPNATVIVNTNPVDTMTQYFYKKCHEHNPNFAKTQVVGLSGQLDEQRFRRSIRRKCSDLYEKEGRGKGLSDDRIKFAKVVGQHSDEFMVPTLDEIRIVQDDGRTELTLKEHFEKLLDGDANKDKRVAQIVSENKPKPESADPIEHEGGIGYETKFGGAIIGNLRGRSAHWGPAGADTIMIKAIIDAKYHEKQIPIRCSSWCSDIGNQGFFGQEGTFGADGKFTPQNLSTLLEQLSNGEGVKLKASIKACQEELKELPDYVPGQAYCS